MEMKENIVVISTLEYRDLILRAEKAREKEADIIKRITIEKDRFYENMYNFLLCNYIQLPINFLQYSFQHQQQK